MAQEIKNVLGTSVFIYNQKVDENISQKITITKTKVKYEIFKDGKFVNEIISSRPYRLGNPNDGTNANCLCALLMNLAPDILEALKDRDFDKETIKMYSDCQKIGNREGVVVPANWGVEEISLLREAISETRLDVLRKII